MESKFKIVGCYDTVNSEEIVLEKERNPQNQKKMLWIEFDVMVLWEKQNEKQKKYKNNNMIIKNFMGKTDEETEKNKERKMKHANLK